MYQEIHNKARVFFTSLMMVDICTLDSTTHWSKLIFNNQPLFTPHALYTHVTGALKQQYLVIFQPHTLLKQSLQL